MCRKTVDVKNSFGKYRDVSLSPLIISMDQVFFSIKNPKTVLTQIATMHCIGNRLKTGSDDLNTKIKSFINEIINIWPKTFIDATSSNTFLWHKVAKESDYNSAVINTANVNLSGTAKRQLNLVQYKPLTVIQKISKKVSKK